MFTAKKIWTNDINTQDEYVDFFGSFKYTGNAPVHLHITCDGSFTFWINDKKFFFGSCADFPNDKVYYVFDLTKYCQEENNFKITVWHSGSDTQTYINADAFLAFKVISKKQILCESGEDILSCKNPNYLSGYKKLITTQLGFSFLYDNTVDGLQALSKSCVYGECNAKRRKVSNLKLLKPAPATIIETDNGYIFDLGKETVGFVYIDIESDCKQKITIAYGEHLYNGHVKQNIHGREFSVEFIAKQGDNKYLNTFRRIAGRYLEIQTKNIKINAITIRPTVYPVIRKQVDIKDKLTEKIYKTCVYTLECCMHEHYEDCPWREQALYTMDSRNQMLCGYYAFKGYKFQRENLVLISKSLRADGLLSICAPSGLDLPIPFFTLVYPIQVYEYIKYSGDKSILKEVGHVIRKIKGTFASKVSSNNLIPAFGAPYWDFYEWTEGSDHCNESFSTYNGRYDLILNCMYIHSLKYIDALIGEKTDVSLIKTAIVDNFYNKEKALYKLDNKSENYSVLGNAFALLVGLGDNQLTDKLINNKNLIPSTLSMKTFVYDALLNVSEKYSKWIIEDIESTYTYMLDNGATTFWETIVGAEDFGGAGSLCHGWSALPIYYYNLFGMTRILENE